MNAVALDSIPAMTDAKFRHSLTESCALPMHNRESEAAKLHVAPSRWREALFVGLAVVGSGSADQN